jgi:hypothetical protein
MAAAVLLVAVCPSRFARRRLGLILLTRALVAARKDADLNIAAVAEVTANACASRCRGRVRSKDVPSSARPWRARPSATH